MKGVKKIRRESFEMFDDIMLTQSFKIHLISIKELNKKNRYKCERKIKELTINVDFIIVHYSFFCLRDKVELILKIEAR